MKGVREVGIWFAAILAVTAFFYISAAAYIRSIGDLAAIPRIAWVLFGPALGLGSGHGIPAYAAAIVLVVPFVIGARAMANPWSAVSAMMAVVSWVGIGWLMA